jgi:hypothetical protein
MRRIDDTPDAGVWVDIYSKKGFQGRLVRLRVPGKRAIVHECAKVGPIGSVIVSPEAIAEFTRRGDSGRTRLSQRTILADASHLTNGKGLKNILVTPARK